MPFAIYSMLLENIHVIFQLPFMSFIHLIRFLYLMDDLVLAS